jgi:hypothetical protein
MNNDILIIVDALVEPPSEPFAFRTITMIASDNLEMDILFHTTQAMKDLYYHWMKPKGLLDYVDYILNEQENENGIRIDVCNTYPRTLVVQALTLDNQISVIGKLRWLTSIE